MGGLFNSTLTRSGGSSMLARNTNVDDCESRGYLCVHGHACRFSHENGHAHVGGCAYASDWLTIRGHGSDCAHACVDASLSWHRVLSEVELGQPSVSNKNTTASRICRCHSQCANTKPLFRVELGNSWLSWHICRTDQHDAF